MDFDCAVLSGQLSLHVDNPENSSMELNALCDTLSLTQHVQRSTHSLGRSLDLVITKGLDVSIGKDLTLSDNICLFFDVSASQHIQNRSITVQ